MVQIRITYHGVFTDYDDALDFAVMRHVDGFSQGYAVVGRQLNSPGFFKFCTYIRVGDCLIGRISNRQGAHVASSLHIILPAQRIYSGAGFAQVACQQGQIAHGFHIICTGTMLGHAHGIADRSYFRLGINASRLADICGGYTGDFFGCFRSIIGYNRRHCFIAFGTVGNKLLVQQIFADNDIHHGIDQRHIGTRFELHVDVSHLCQFDAPRIGHDQFGSVFAYVTLNFVTNNRMVFGGIGAN